MPQVWHPAAGVGHSPVVARPQIGVSSLSGLAGNTFCVIATSAANQRAFSMDIMSWRVEEQIWKSPSANDRLFQTVLWERSAEVWLGFTFVPSSVFQDFRCVWNELPNKLPLTMKHFAWFFTGFPWQVQVWDGNNVRRVGRACGAGADSKSGGAGQWRNWRGQGCAPPPLAS